MIPAGTRRVFWALVLTGAIASSSRAQEPIVDPYEVVRGMTISCPGAGEIWGSDTMVDTLRKLRELGVNWVTIHPYGGIHGDGSVGRSRIDRLYRNPYWLTRAIEESHRLGLKIMIKPHLAYWGSKFSWRGEIAFDDPAHWQRFFETYEEWITMVARLSRSADAFVVGTELDRTVAFESEWRDIIAAVRRESNAPLTYSASWNSYELVPFWDALDVIAVQAYFPLVEHEGIPTREEIGGGWARIVEQLDAYGAAHDRKVVLGELGYNRSLLAAVRPWSYQTHSDPEAERLQLLCLETALYAIRDSDSIVGAFLWKWFPGEVAYGNFRKSAPAVQRIISDNWFTK